MGKRSDFERHPRDYYPTPIEAVIPLISYLPSVGLFAEPCVGDGRLISHIEKLTGLNAYWMTDIEPRNDHIGEGDATTDQIVGCSLCITNPPWGRHILHPIIENLSAQMPTWLLIDADWSHTKQARAYLTRCSHIIAIGRVKWIEGSKNTGKDNACWYRFTPDETDTIFINAW